MNSVKARKVGNSITITLPKTLGVVTGQEYIVHKGQNDVIILVPKLANPFDGTTDLRMEDDFEGVALFDHEY